MIQYEEQMLYRRTKMARYLCRLVFVMPRFVVLTHDHPFQHWDLMLEQGDVLRTWRLLEEPVLKGPIAAQLLPDHRVKYLDYEGPVSGNRGRVSRWDAGDFEVIDACPARLEVRLCGDKLRGNVVLEADGDKQSWTFYASPG